LSDNKSVFRRIGLFFSSKLKKTAKIIRIDGLFWCCCETLDFSIHLCSWNESNMKSRKYIVPVRISGVTDGQQAFDISVKPDQVGLPPEFDSEVSLHINLDKTHSQILLQVSMTASAEFECDNCLEMVRIPVQQCFTLVYTYDNTATRSFNDDDIRLVDPNDTFVELADDVKDYCLLGIPMRRVCGENEQGDATCHVQTNVLQPNTEKPEMDPRWEPLAKL